MTEGEARAWLLGQRSHQSTFLSINGVPENRTAVLADVARADAAMLDQAFTVVRYHDYVRDRARAREEDLRAHRRGIIRSVLRDG